MRRYHCNTCWFETDVRVVMKDHAALLGHFGWTDNEATERVIEGKTLRITRLDADGNPTGVPLLMPGSMSIEFPETEEQKWTAGRRQFYSIAVNLDAHDLNPDTLALLTGFKFKPRPWWWRVIPTSIKNRIKRREIRHGYGG